MERSFLDKYYRLEREHWWFRERARILGEIVRKEAMGRQNLRILNVGAATGRSTEILQPFGTVSSVEYDEPSFIFCRDELKMDIVQASITELPFEDGVFDLVCCFDVVEHVENDAQAVAELFRVCRPGGIIFVTVPAFMSLWSDHDIINQHFRRYTQKGLLDLFRRYGGLKIRSSYFNALLFPPIWLTRRLQQLIKGKQQRPLKPDNEFMQSAFTDKIFGFIFSLERILLRFMNFPVGVSLMVVWMKSRKS